MKNYNTELINRFNLEKNNEYLGLDKPVNKIQPLVSISVATYQHKDFIKDCIEGILMQQVNFLYEIIIGDDESNDGTTEICKAYAEKYPDKIRLFIRDRKTSHYYENGKFVGRYNGIWCRMSCRGKYIALCEGDDYWTDPLKLQKQVDFLEKNEDYSLISAKAYTLEVNKEKRIIGGKRSLNTYTLKDIMAYNDFITCTVLFRNKKIDYSFFLGKTFGDWTLYTLLLEDASKAYVMDEVVSIYRIHGGGVMKSMDKIMINYNLINQYLSNVDRFAVKLDDFSIKEMLGIFNYTLKHEIRNFNIRKSIKILVYSQKIGILTKLMSVIIKQFINRLKF